MLKVGDIAPDFALADQHGKMVRLSEIKGSRYSVIFFYPKDHSPGCSAQSCSFRDNYGDIRAIGAQVIGISADSSSSHQKFAENNNLPYPLLSDPQGVARKIFGVPKTLGILPGRATFIIDANNKICFAFSSQLQIQRHVDDALATLKQLQASA